MPLKCICSLLITDVDNLVVICMISSIPFVPSSCFNLEKLKI